MPRWVNGLLAIGELAVVAILVATGAWIGARACQEPARGELHAPLPPILAPQSTPQDPAIWPPAWGYEI